MLKQERHRQIVALVEENNIMKVSDLMNILHVSDMTIRRDLVELEESGYLNRIHGGARANENSTVEKTKELSHTEKQQINIEEKYEVAQMIVNCINDNDVIFLGAGTTIELVPRLLTQSNLKIVTNSLPVFNKLQENKDYEVVLIGGTYRKTTGAFVGGLTNSAIVAMKTGKAFIGVNGIYNNIITNYNEEEGATQRIILDNAIEKYIIADSSKLNVLDFYHFYNMEDVTALITDSNISKEDLDKYSKYTEILKLIDM